MLQIVAPLVAIVWTAPGICASLLRPRIPPRQIPSDRISYRDALSGQSPYPELAPRAL